MEDLELLFDFNVYYDDDYYYDDDWMYEQEERQESIMGLNPDDYCEMCGRSNELCDCEEEDDDYPYGVGEYHSSLGRI